MATITQTKLVGFCLGDKTNYNATAYANHIWFDPTNKQILLNGIEYIPKKLSELVNDSGFLTSITKSMVENVLTGNITSHTHSYLPLSGGTLTGDLILPYNKRITTGGLVIDHKYSPEVNNIIYKNNRINPSEGGWADEIITVKDSTDNSVFSFGVYGNNNKLSYSYLGTNSYDGDNFRIYSDKLAFGNNVIYHAGNLNKSIIENVLTGNITSHTHTFASLTSKPTTLSGYGITNAMQFETYDAWSYVNASFSNSSLAQKAANTYIELWQSGAGWFNLMAGKFITNGGTSTQFLKGDGSLDSNTYALASDLGKYLPLTGGTLSGNLTCNGSYINMNGDSGAKGYKGYFNQSGTSNRASGSHVFMGNGQALGSNAISLGYNAFAGIRNQDADKGTYPYIAWQWMPTEKIHITINNQDTANGEFYGYEVLGGKMVQYEIGGNTYTYENTSTTVRVLVCVKDDADTGLIFGGKSYMPFNVTKTLIQGKYILGRGESITAVNTVTVGEVNYYVLAIYTWSATVGYDYSTQVKVMCATKVNNSNYSGASSYASGYYSVASGNSSVASGYFSVASGYASVASGYSSVASGESSVASGESSVASGNSSVASGSSSVASGAYSVASGSYSVASGASSVASHNHCVVLARNGETQSSYQTIVGKFNAKVAGLFIIGNGTSDTARSNAFVVDDSGNVTAKYFSGYANAVGGEGFKIYPENTNQINFGGTGSDTTIVFGAASKDSRSVPTTYKFGADGKAILEGLARRLAYTSISQNADINTFINEGVYSTTQTSIMNSLVNAPTNRLNGEMRLEVISSSSSTTYIIQKFWSRDAGSGWKLHIRTTSSGGWTAWKEIALTDSSITGNAATATKLKTPRTLWGNSFDGSGSVSGDLTFVDDGQTSQSSHGMRKGSIYGGFIGFSNIIGKTQPDGTISGAFTGISLGWGANPEDNVSSVRINNSIFTYKTYPILHSNNFSDYAPTKTGSGASGTWGISISGNANTATALTSSAGSATQPIYFSNGKPVACSYTLAKSVPSNAVFTDTTYSVATANADGLMSSAMFEAEMVKSVNVRQGGTAVIGGGTITNHSVYITQNKNNLTNSYVNADGDGDVKIPNATTTYDGSMSYTDKRKLSHVSDNGYCTVASVFTMNVNTNYSNLDALNEVEFSASDFAGLTDVLGNSRESVQPEFIRLKLLSTGVVYGYTLYESDNNLDVYKYVCYPHNSEIVYDGGMVNIQPIS